jgi:tetratricopeptide (TPR) repeat protein
MFSTRRLAIAIAAVSLAISVSACGGADARRATHMDRGQKFFAEGNYDKARVEFRNALQITPNDADARFMNGRVAEKLGDLRSAAGMYQGAIEANPDHLQARANLGRMLVFGGGAQRALEVIGPGLEKHPDDASLLTVRGAARSQLKDRDGALADGERALTLAPDNNDAIALVASLYRQSNQTERAIELVRGYVAKHADTVDLRQVLASLYLSVNDSENALKELRKIVELRPKELSSRMTLALQYARARQPEEAEKVMRQATEALPDSYQAKLAYVEFLTGQGARERGEAALRGFIEKEPKNYDLQLGLGAQQQRNGNADAALATYRKVLEGAGEAPAAITARNRIAALEVDRGNYDEARKLVDATLEKNPRDNDALLLRGNLALARNDAAGAVADLRAVLREQPTAVGVLRTLARAHVANGEPALGEEALRQAMDVAGNDIGVRVELAQLLVQTNRGEQAVSLLEEAVQKNPANIQAREALTRAYLSMNDLDAAKTSAEDLKTAAPTLSIGPYLAGLVAQTQKRLDDASANFSRALELQPTASDALAAITRVDFARGQRAQAVARLKSAVAADAKNVVARNLLGETLLSEKDFPEAIAAFTEVTKGTPQWWLPWRNLAIAQLAKGDSAAAVATYEAGVTATKHEPMLVSDLAALYEKTGRPEDAIKQYEKLHEQRPRLEVAANNLAMLLITYRKDRPSLDRARALTESFAKSDNGALLDTHGWVTYKLGQFNEALPVLERAASRAPNSKVIRYHLAMAQLKTGQRDQARDNLQHAVEGSASFSGVDEAKTVLASLKDAG